MKVLGTNIDFAASLEDHFAEEVRRLRLVEDNLPVDSQGRPFIPPPISEGDLLMRYNRTGMKKLR